MKKKMLSANRVLKNVSWIVVCRIFQSIFSLVVGMLTARYLGPSGNGLVSYAAALVSFAAPLMQLGFKGTLVQELVSKPDKEGEILGTSLGLSLISSLGCMLGVTAFSAALNPNSPQTTVICALYSLVLVFQAIELLHYWFHAKLLSKYPSILMLVAYIIMSVYKIVLLATGQSIYWFAVSNSVDAVVIAVGMLIMYRVLKGSKLRFSFSLGKELFRRSKHYILPAMMVSIFQQCDRIMIKGMLGDEATGLYAASITCVGVTGFVFAAIIDSAQPMILEKQKEDAAGYEKGLSMLYGVIFYLGVAQAVFMTVFAKPLVWILYGEAYLQSASALRIAAWYVVFAYMGSVRSIWIVSQNKQNRLWIVFLSSALINIVLNAFLINIYGINGAAFATVVAQVVSNFIIGFIMPSLKSNNKLMLAGMNPKILFSVLHYIKQKK